MGLFRKKPVVIEAYHWSSLEGAPRAQAPGWLMEAALAGTVRASAGGTLTIKTLEGEHKCGVGDWIIRGVKGELYPCKPDIFAATYEPV